MSNDQDCPMSPLPDACMPAATATCESGPCAGKPVRVRDRIFEAARGLFYQNGFRSVGVDAIVAACDSNKMSFYRAFESKDALIAEYLRDSEKGYWQWWAMVTQPWEGQPRRQIEALFGELVAKTCGEWQCGCPHAKALVEFHETDHPARQVAAAFKAEVRGRLRALAAQAGARDADALGDALMLLMEGCQTTKLAFAQHGPLYAAEDAVKRLLDAYGATDPAR